MFNVVKYHIYISWHMQWWQSITFHICGTVEES